MSTLLRQRGRADSNRVGMIELFFDLVFVFAVTQLSHALLKDLSPGGLFRVTLLFIAVWWVWSTTTWVTNWLDPERLPVRSALLVLMLLGLIVSVSIPEAFGERAHSFTVAYVAMQVGRTLFFLWAVRNEAERHRRNFQRILVWLAAAGILWIVGGFAEGNERLAWWTLAMFIEFVGPWVFFWVPGLGRSTTMDWDVDGGHMAERYALFVIIALGESILVTGATFAELEWTSATVVAAISAVIGTILMWWIYFDTGAERAHHRIAHSSDPGRQARGAYTYMHALIVAGIIGCAVADEVVLMHPEHGTTAGLVAILGGPFCYLIGTALFKWTTNDRRGPPLSHLAGMVLLALLAWPMFSHAISPLGAGVMTTAALAVVAVWESVAIRSAFRVGKGTS